MPKGSPELKEARREEIISACAKLYETMGFKEIMLGDIAKSTSFSRPSIYNYFHTKEEIFLALFGREYDCWTADLDDLRPEKSDAPRLEFAAKVAGTIGRRGRLLKLLSCNLYDMELNSRPENLLAFKISYGAAIEAVRRCLGRFCPDMEEAEREDFISAFFPLIYGIYPYAVISDEQREAMEKAGVNYRSMTIYEIAFLGAKKLLGV